MIGENIRVLQQNALNALSTSTIYDFEGKPICYLNLLVEEATGKFLDLTPESRVMYQEGAVSIPLIVENPLKNAQLRLAFPDEVDQNIKHIVENTLTRLNSG